MIEKKYSNTIRDTLREELLRDEKVFLMGESIGGKQNGIYKVTMGLQEEFGELRVMETPISEAAIAGAAVGAAVFGMRPVAEIMFSNLLALCMDEIHNQAGKFRYVSGGQVKVPMVIRTPTWMRAVSGPHHCGLLDAWLIHSPGIKVVAPATPSDAKGLLKASIRDDDPVIFIEHTALYNVSGIVSEDDYEVPIGVAEVKREGNDVSIITYGILVHDALEAAELLQKEGISVEVLDLRSLKPLDSKKILESVKKTGRVVVAHEGPKIGGVGAEISAMIAEEAVDYLNSPIIRVAAPDAPQPANGILVNALAIDRNKIIKGVKKTIQN